jgi:hypothetical protein
LCPLNEVPGWESAFPRPDLFLSAIVEAAEPKLVTLRPEDLEFAVDILLKTRMPKWHTFRGHPDARPDGGRVTLGAKRDAAIVKWAQERIAHCQDEIAMLEKHALQITKRVGILSDTADAKSEGIEWYADLALRIQLMFDAKKEHRITGKDLEHKSWGGLDIHLSFTSSGTSFQLRPRSVSALLIYYAAKMITNGAVARTCDNCHTSFIGGGHGRGRKKRTDARFCGDRCRWEFHNEQNRKAKEG